MTKRKVDNVSGKRSRTSSMDKKKVIYYREESVGSNATDTDVESFSRICKQLGIGEFDSIVSDSAGGQAPNESRINALLDQHDDGKTEVVIVKCLDWLISNSKKH